MFWHKRKKQLKELSIPSEQRDKMMKMLLDREKEYRSIDYPQSVDFLHDLQDSPESCAVLFYLEAKNYISMQLDVNDILIAIIIEPLGRSYFEDILDVSETQHKEDTRYYVTTIIAFAALVLSLISLFCK